MKFHRTLPIVFQNFQIYTKTHLKLLFYLKNPFTKFLKNMKFHSIIFKNFSNSYKAHLKLLFYLKNPFTKF